MRGRPKIARSQIKPLAVMSFASLASYRRRTIAILIEEFGDTLEIFAGDRAEDPAIRVLTDEDLPITTVRNRYLPGHVLVQSVPLPRLLRAQSLLMDLNPRVPHIWLVLICRKVMGRPTGLWGHAWPRSGRGSRSDILRGAMRRLASSLVTYTNSQAEELRGAHPGKPVLSAPNALYARDECGFISASSRDSLLYVGRLTPEKKPLLLLNAFEELSKADPSIRLVIVGDGALLDEVRSAAAKSRATERITIAGYVDDTEEIRDLYAHAIASVSPGYVGLSITQSLSFGVPMIVSRHENHAPEIEAAVAGKNSLFFETDSSQDLTNVMLEVVRNRETWAMAGPEISRACAEDYSVERMAKGLSDALSQQFETVPK